MGERHKLDDVRRGRVPADERPTLPQWADVYDDDMREVLARHIHRAKAPWNSDAVWRDISELCATVQQQRVMLRQVMGAGVLVEDGEQ